MQAAIITVPGREAALKRLTDVIVPEVDGIQIYVDTNRQGHWWNLSRCMREMLNNAPEHEPTLIMTDDAITVPGWRRKWEEIHSRAKNDVYTLFGRQKHLFTPENINRGYVTKCQLRGFYDQAAIYINKRGLMDDILTWFSRGGCMLPRVKNRQNHLDVVIQEYFLYHNKPWTITTPTLFDHQAVKSTMGHAVGGSPCYIGRHHENLR